MGFTVASPGTPVPPAPGRLGPVRAPLGKVWKTWTAPGVCEVVKAATADGEWLFERQADGTWAAGHLPTKTVVREHLGSLRACRAYAASGAAKADLERIRAHQLNDTEQERNAG